MVADVTVTLITAVWGTPCVFEGFLEVALPQGRASAEYGFRAELSWAECRFTWIGRAGSPDWRPPGGATWDTAVQLLSYVLRETVALLHQRERTRARQTLGLDPERVQPEDVGYQVQFPYTSSDDEVTSAMRLLLGLSERPAPAPILA